MKGDYRNRVNQKLAFGRLNLQAVEPTQSPLQAQALLESSCFHLYCALRAFFKELADSYSLSGVDQIHSLSALQEQLMAQGQVPAEVRELAVLAETQDSWFNGLLAAYTQVQNAESSAQPVRAEVLSLAAAGDSRCTAANLQAWLGQLTEMINRHRESMLEY